jgi:hypothetical protein
MQAVNADGLFYGMAREKNLLTLCATSRHCVRVMRTARWKMMTVAAAIMSAAGAAPAVAQPQTGWDLALTGGFVASGLVDPVFALGSVAGQPTRVVVRQRDQESTVNLNVAMFGQVYHDRWPWIAPISIGVGIRGDSRASVFMGSALRFGSHASFTAGVAIGPVSALPAGTIEGRTVTDTNALSNLITRTTHSWFTGVTYTFASIR